MKILSKKEKIEITKKLDEEFGIKKIQGTILQHGKGKLRIFSGNLNKDLLLILKKNFVIENIGLYFAKEEKDEIRLTFDGVQIFKDQISKNILEISDEEKSRWLKGEELYKKNEKGWKILKNRDDFFGCGKSTGEKIANFVPKGRRIK